jgi:hypothetical protein
MTIDTAEASTYLNVFDTGLRRLHTTTSTTPMRRTASLPRPAFRGRLRSGRMGPKC